MTALREIGLAEFFLRTRWNPTSYYEPSCGFLFQIVSSLMVNFAALLVAIPLGIASTAYIAYGTALVLSVLVLAMNGLAVMTRYRFRKRMGG